MVLNDTVRRLQFLNLYIYMKFQAVHLVIILYVVKVYKCLGGDETCRVLS